MKRILRRIGKPIGSNSESAAEPVYRGSTKHENRPADGAKGTLCPEWTHRSHVSGLGTDMREHSWKTTRAAALFADATLDGESRRRFATENGIAFAAMLLMPRMLVRRALPLGVTTWNDVASAAKVLQVSPSTLVEHLYNTCVIDAVMRDSLRSVSKPT